MYLDYKSEVYSQQRSINHMKLRLCFPLVNLSLYDFILMCVKIIYNCVFSYRLIVLKSNITVFLAVD
jgi:hypothetical protein